MFKHLNWLQIGGWKGHLIKLAHLSYQTNELKIGEDVAADSSAHN